MSAARPSLAKRPIAAEIGGADRDRVSCMREAGRIVARVLSAMQERVRPGVGMAELDALGERIIREGGAVPSFKGYRGYPSSLCISVNEEVVHGIPAARVLRDGDIVSIDVGARYGGYHGDAAVTLAVGDIDPKASKLLEVTRGALHAGIARARAGRPLGDVSWAIQNHVESRGFSIIREYTGHGIGANLHEEPTVFNFGRRGTGRVLAAGQTIAIEPMVSAGDPLTRVREDGWTVATRDGSLSAHFEHTILIGDSGAQVLTELEG